MSHIWATGQDQVAVIKRQMQIILPGARIFLDVDDLKDVGALEQHIEESAAILILALPPLRRRPPSTLGSCLSGTLEAVVFTAPSSPIHLRLVECWRFTKDL